MQLEILKSRWGTAGGFTVDEQVPVKAKYAKQRVGN